MRRPVDLLREMSEGDLADLLRARSDLTRPAPSSLGELSNRACMYGSVYQAVRGLTAFKLAVIEALCLLEPDPPLESVAAVLGADAAEISTALAALQSLLLAFEEGGRAHLLPAVRTAVANPGGLGPPLRVGLGALHAGAVRQIAVNLGLATKGSKDSLIGVIAEALSEPDNIRKVIQAAPEDVRSLVLRIGAQSNHALYLRSGMGWDGGPAVRPAERAQAIGLLVPHGWDELALPREVGFFLRGGLVRDVRPDPPTLTGDAPERAAIERAAGASAQDLLGLLVALLDECGQRPVVTLKTGGIGVRELRRIGKRLELDEGPVARLIELALAAELLGVSHKSEAVVPSEVADRWLAEPAAHRWVALAGAWRRTPRYPSLAGAEGLDGRSVPALIGHGSVGGDLLRGEVLELLLRTGVAVPRMSIEAFLGWQFPRRFEGSPASLATVIGWILDEAALLGVTGLGALSEAGAAIHRGELERAEKAAAHMLPAALATFTVQADLTAIVPGTLEPATAAILADMADKESGGGATVWRFTEGSVRRAFDRGRTREELDGFLDVHAAHGVPQTLSYLIGDVARRHGNVRVAAGLTVVHSDDPAIVAQVATHRRLAKLGWRTIAPTVAVTAAKPAEALNGLRAAGFLPVQEQADGTIELGDVKKHRADVTIRPHTTPRRPDPEVDADRLAAALLRGRRDGPAAPSLWEQDDAVHAEDIAEIQRAIEEEHPVLLGYRTASGPEVVIVGDPVRVSRYEVLLQTDRGPQTFLLSNVAWIEMVDWQEAEDEP